MSQKRLETEVKVGVFVSLGAALIMLAILLLGSTESLLSRKITYHVHFTNIEGLMEGAKVVLGGVQIGTVKNIGFDNARHDIQVDLSVMKGSTSWLHKDAAAEIATQGVLGDKYVSIYPGSPNAPPLPPGSNIPNVPSKGFSQFLHKGDRLLISLNDLSQHLDMLVQEFNTGNRSATFFQGMAMTAKNLSEATAKLNHQLDGLHLKKIMFNIEQITDKINDGNGTVGALINDPSLYDTAKALVGEANRNRIMRNLVRQTIRESEEKAAEAEKKRSEKERR